MTLEEAIKHCEEVEESCERGNPKKRSKSKCASEHRQLAEWLKELKALKAEPCEDAISREAALEAILTMVPDWCGGDEGGNLIGRNETASYIRNLPSVAPERRGFVRIGDIYRLIAGHSDYHGDNILSALTCLAEGKEVKNPIAVLKQNPETMNNKQWIEWTPVSERPPEDRRPVLVTAYWHETYQTMMASYFGGGVWWCVPFSNTGKHEQKLKPKAWRPLPEPYKQQESEVKE